MKTTTITMIILICIIAFCVLYIKEMDDNSSFVIGRNYELVKENTKIKKQIKEYCNDKNFYKRDDDIYINIGLLHLKKVKNLEELENLKNKGYK